LALAALWLGILIGMAEANGASPASPAMKSPSYARVPGDMPLHAVEWTGGFWQDRVRCLRDIYLPTVLDGSSTSIESGNDIKFL
jgi:hypothetical protein